jgi:hypothetical protein
MKTQLRTASETERGRIRALPRTASHPGSRSVRFSSDVNQDAIRQRNCLKTSAVMNLIGEVSGAGVIHTAYEVNSPYLCSR